MKTQVAVVFVVVVVAFLSGQVRCRPQYGSGGGGGGGEPDCVTRFRDVNDITTTEEFRQVCNPVTKPVCVTKYRPKCVPFTDEECRTETRRDCRTLTRDKCFDDFRDASESYTEDECKDEVVRKCEQGWVEQGYNDKVWEDLPETCKDLTQTNCAPVQKVRTVKEKYTKCDKEPYEDCKDVPERKCVPVTRERCNDEAYEDCHDETTQVCEEKHFKVPKQVTRKVAVQVCKDATGKFPAEVPVGPAPGSLDADAEIISSDPRAGLGVRTGGAETEGAEYDDPEKIVFG